MIFNNIVYLLLICVLVISSVYDIKTRLLPIRAMILFTAVLWGTGCFYVPNDLLMQYLIASLFGGAYGFIVYFIMAKYFGGGGGDVIYMGCIGILMGTGIFVIIFLSSLCYLVYGGISKKKGKTEVAYIPCVLAAMILYFPIYLYF